MGRTPDGRLDMKAVGTLIGAVVVALGLGTGGGYMAGGRGAEASPPGHEARLVRLEEWRTQHTESARETKEAIAEIAAALRESARSTDLLRQTVLTALSEQATRMAVVEQRVTALETRRTRSTP